MIHGIEDTPLDRFETVTGIRQRAFLNNVFRITAEAGSHDVFKQLRNVFCIVFNYFLFRHALLHPEIVFECEGNVVFDPFTAAFRLVSHQYGNTALRGDTVFNTYPD